MDTPITERNSPTETYAGMVKRLFKTMETEAATLMHAGAGIAGEACELLLACARRDNKNILEEMGDARFYIQKFFTVFGWDMDTFRYMETPTFDYGHGSVPVDVFVIEAGEILDMAKKGWVYNKELDVLVLFDHMHALVFAYCAMLELYNLTDEQVQAGNVYKLVTGPNARFPLGYTDAAAIARADKVAEAGASDLGSHFQTQPAETA